VLHRDAVMLDIISLAVFVFVGRLLGLGEDTAGSVPENLRPNIAIGDSDYLFCEHRAQTEPLNRISPVLRESATQLFSDEF
jgi:hypothetical protein